MLVVLCSYLRDCTQAFSFSKGEGWESTRDREREGQREEGRKVVDWRREQCSWTDKAALFGM